MPNLTAQPEALPRDPRGIAEQLLAVLRRTGRAHRVIDIAEAFGLSDAWECFESALDALGPGLLLLTSGCRGFELRAA